MAIIFPPIPSAGLPNSTEDPKIATALGEIRDAINGNLDDTNIAPAANIDGAKLDDLSIPTAKIADLGITLAKMAADSVNADKLTDSATTDSVRAVTTNHIRDKAVTDTKLSSSSSVNGDRAVDTNHIKTDAVTQAKIADNAVGAAQAKVRVLWATGSSSSSGEQVLASVFVQPGRYMVLIKSAGAGTMQLTSTGAATLSEPGANTAPGEKWQLVEATNGTTLQMKSTTTGTRTGHIYVIGIEN